LFKLRVTSKEFNAFEAFRGTIRAKIAGKDEDTHYGYLSNKIMINPNSLTHTYLDRMGSEHIFTFEIIVKHEYQEAKRFWSYFNDNLITNHCQVIQATNAMLSGSPSQACLGHDGTIDTYSGGDYKNQEGELKSATEKLLRAFY
jgi:hypothetical protein